jgi:hypothetical protein
MGQYYKPIALNEEGGNPVKAWMYSHEYDNGLKLMEHSYINNNFVNAFESQLAEGHPLFKSKVVWAGDYADEEKGTSKNLYSLCVDKNKINPPAVEPMTYRYLINHTKKLFVDKTKVPENDGWKIHPLPLLTAEGNGQGGGDFRNDDPKNIIGSWSRNSISASNEVPKGFKEILFELTEN